MAFSWNFPDSVTAHVMHNLNTEITSYITAYVYVFDGANKKAYYVLH